MTVSELIEQLKDCAPNARVLFKLDGWRLALAHGATTYISLDVKEVQSNGETVVLS